MKSLISIVLIYIFSSCSDKRTQASEQLRPSNISDSAFYVEGGKGGYWYTVHYVNGHQNKAEISVSDGKTGRLVIKKEFTMMCRNDNMYFIGDLKKQIQDFDGEKIYLKSPNEKEGCSLW
jgi:hypothetical protein